MRTGFVQTGFLHLTTPLGKDALLLDEMEGTEGISELFKFTLHMRAGSTSLVAANIVGKVATVLLSITGGPKRYINGIVSRFTHSGYDVDFATYQAELVPKLWLLTLSRDRKIYQTKSVADVIKAVLGEFAITFESKLTATYTAQDYIVQYDETAFEFISRLMERAGIFYFFKFASGTHTMVLADATSAHLACTDAATVRFFPPNGTDNPIDTISRFEHEHRVVLKKATLSDYDFEKATTSLQGLHTETSGEGEIYEYPAGNDTAAAATALAKIRVQASQVTGEVLRGDSYVYAFTAGTKFTLSDHFVTMLNTSHVLRRLHHTARGDLYSNSFEAFPATVPFRPPMLTPRPTALGSETALVVGSTGEEIWTDKFGRIKVQFPWDRLGKKNDTSSPWIRVAQPVAGNGFGTLFLPRVGQEVVVTYINGDPERPLVTGCVYNSGNTTPVTLPANSTQSTIKTRSSKSGTAGNELRFEDKKDSEQLFMHAQKDMKIDIENDLESTLIKGDETHTLTEGNRTVELKKGNETHKVKGTRSLEMTGNETHTNKAKFTHTVDGDYALTIKGKLTIEVTGAISISSDGSVAINSGTAFTAEAGTALTNQAGTALTNKAGTALTNQAGTALTNKGLNLTNEATMQLENKGAIINSKASTMHTVEAGALLTLKGAIAKIN